MDFMKGMVGKGEEKKEEGKEGEKKEGEKKEGEEKKEGDKEEEKKEDKIPPTKEEIERNEKRLKDQEKAQEALLKKKAQMAAAKREYKYSINTITITNTSKDVHDPYVVFRLGRNRKVETIKGKKVKKGKRGAKYKTEPFKKLPPQKVGESTKVFVGRWYGTYGDLENQKFIVQVWDWNFFRNTLVVEKIFTMEQLANSSVNQEIEFEVEKEKDMVPYATVKFQAFFDEIFSWQLNFTEWIGMALKPADMINGVPTTSDPFVKFAIPHQKKKLIYPKDDTRQTETAVCRATLYPQWDTCLTPLYYRGTHSDLDNEILVVDVYDWDMLSKNDLIGQARVPLSGVFTENSTGFLSIGLALEEDEFIQAPEKKSKVKPGEKAPKKRKGPPQPPKMIKTGNKVWNDYGLIRGFIKPEVTPLHRQKDIPVFRRPEINYLAIKIEQAEHLKAADLNGLSDPFVAVEWDGSRLETTVKSKTLNPKFGETLYFGIKAAKITGKVLAKKGPVKISCFDWDESGSNDFLGFAKFSLDKITSSLNVKGATETKGRMYVAKLPLELPGVKTESCVYIRAWFEPELYDIEVEAVEENKIKALPKPYLSRHKDWKAVVPRRNLANPNVQKYNIAEVDEEGNSRFLCAYLSPIMTPKTIHGVEPTAEMLARLCRAITFSSDFECLGSEKEYFISPPFFMDMKKGDADTHSVFLCNLFLGMGLDAYVCVGSARGHKRQHQWVMTREDDGSVKFWETTKGIAYVLPQRWKGKIKPKKEGDEDDDDEEEEDEKKKEEDENKKKKDKKKSKGKKDEKDEKDGKDEKKEGKEEKKVKKKRKIALPTEKVEELEQKQISLLYLDDDEIFGREIIRADMLIDPEERGNGIQLEEVKEEEEVELEDWATLPIVQTPYETLDLVFNQKNIWGNLGHPNPVRDFFNLEDNSKWTTFIEKHLFEPHEDELDKDGNFKPFYEPRTVLSPEPDVKKLESLSKDIQEDLTLALTNHRTDKGLVSDFDEGLSTKMGLMLERLEKYYTERTSVALNGYVSAKTRLIATCPPDHVFAGTPVCLSYTDPKEVRKFVIANYKYQDDPHEKAKMAVSAKVFGYPMSVMVVWVMIGILKPKASAADA